MHQFLDEDINVIGVNYRLHIKLKNGIVSITHQLQTISMSL